MTAKKNDRLTVKMLIAKLSDLAQVKPDAEVYFITAGDDPNDGWPVYEAGLMFDSSNARVLLANDDRIVQ